MTNRQPTDSKNLDQYGNPPLDWDRVRALLDAQSESDHPAWLGTVDPDGRPHAAGVGTVWFDGDMYFVSGPGTRKSRNIAGNPAVSIATSLKSASVKSNEEAFAFIATSLSSLSKNTPFDEARLEGQVTLTLVAGRIVHDRRPSADT